MTRKTAIAVAALIFAAVPGFALAGGPGQTVELDSNVKIREAFPAFHGKVKSHNAACVEQRRVKLFKERRSGGRKLLGFDQTDGDGKWFVEVDPLKSGAYFAVAKRREEGTAGTIFVCLRARSKTVVVD
jgi:hypothetical protein